jgi:uncharacterized protein YydD (DUF2326 family)
MLAFLSSTDSFTKYRHLTNELVTLRADMEMLERRREYIHRLQQLRTDIRRLTEEKTRLQAKIEADVEAKSGDEESLFSRIRLFFNDIVEEVIGIKGLLSVSVNQLGHLEFRAELLGESGNATSADEGHTYKKLMCIAFDLAVLRGHLGEAFPRFAYHDGIFESLDPRKKENLLGVLREYTALGLQSIITLIDSDVPARSNGEPVFVSDEVVLVLHDEGDDGRLFRMKSW